MRVAFDRLRSRYELDVARRTRAMRTDGPPIAEADLERLPPVVQRFLRRVGVLGRPRVHSLCARFVGSLRNGRHGRWMDVAVEQHSFFGDAPARYFLLDARMFGIPFVALHRYEAGRATMQVRVARVFEVIDGRGPEMDRSETVTVFNDMWCLAPATLVDADIAWTPHGEREIAARWSCAGHQVGAVVTFDDDGDLVDFVSDDRMLSADGKRFAAHRWSTPVQSHVELAGIRVVERADAVWALPDGPLPYAHFELVQLTYQ